MLIADNDARLSWQGRESVIAFQDRLQLPGGKPARILHLNSGNLFGGIERMLLALAVHSAGFEATHLFGLCFRGRLFDKLKEIGASVYFLGKVRLLNPLGLFFRRRCFGRLLDEISPDVVVFHGPWMLSLFGKVVSRKRIKLVRMLHSIPSPHFDLIENNARKVKPDLVIANSLATAEAFKRIHPDLPLTVAYPPCILGDYSSRRQLRKKTRSEMRVADSTKVIVSAGRFEDWKGFDVLIEGLSKLPREKDWECWIAGQPHCRADEKVLRNLKKLAAFKGLAGKIKWLGFVEQIEACYAAADVYCQPNKSPESFGMTLVESQAMGCPVITTRFGGAVEVLGNNINNILISKATAENVHSALVKVLDLGATP
jgi:glycosyltransferase involved in cell wall biosynthesis